MIQSQRHYQSASIQQFLKVCMPLFRVSIIPSPQPLYLRGMETLSREAAHQIVFCLHSERGLLLKERKCSP